MNFEEYLRVAEASRQSEAHLAALVLCFFIGAVPILVAYRSILDPVKYRKQWIAIWVWFVFWAFPALSTLWVKGVMG